MATESTMVTAAAELHLHDTFSTGYAGQSVFADRSERCPRCRRLGVAPTKSGWCRIQRPPQRPQPSQPSLVKQFLAAGKPFVDRKSVV
jgi:hypothetical protein